MAKFRITQTMPHSSTETSFLAPKILVKFQCGHTLQGHQIWMGGLKSVIFDQCLAISQKQCKIVT